MYYTKLDMEAYRKCATVLLGNNKKGVFVAYATSSPGHGQDPVSNDGGGISVV